MKVFITGGSGFIGSNLIPKLLEQNHEVYALTRYVSNRTPNYPKGVNVVYGDIRDPVVIRKLIKTILPNVVIHLAAISPVAQSFESPYEVIETNFLGTVNLAHANLENPSLQKFLYAGTSEEYGNQDTFPIKETDAPLRPNTPYAISKVAADNYLRYLEQAYDFPVCVVRPYNTYGRADNFNFVTERIITQMLKNPNQITLGNPDPIRDFLYVDDHVNGYMKVLESKVFPSCVNICTGLGTSIRELAEMIQGLLDYKGEIVWNTTYQRPTEIWSLVGDNSLAKETLGWEPEYSLEEGLILTIEKVKYKLGLSPKVNTVKLE
jgi:dTDP-glucose 4,6-dehydratase